jgi:hypothetical protein
VAKGFSMLAGLLVVEIEVVADRRASRKHAL